MRTSLNKDGESLLELHSLLHQRAFGLRMQSLLVEQILEDVQSLVAHHDPRNFARYLHTTLPPLVKYCAVRESLTLSHLVKSIYSTESRLPEKLLRTIYDFFVKR